MIPNSKLLPFIELRQQDATLVLEMEATAYNTKCLFTAFIYMVIFDIKS